uniref:Uncharacterized protein n=1 Tax=Panagrellus redivivus TaxID=6233 RepID=A0A7E4V1L0_PANRE
MILRDMNTGNRDENLTRGYTTLASSYFFIFTDFQPPVFWRLLASIQEWHSGRNTTPDLSPIASGKMGNQN